MPNRQMTEKGRGWLEQVWREGQTRPDGTIREVALVGRAKWPRLATIVIEEVREQLRLLGRELDPGDESSLYFELCGRIIPNYKESDEGLRDFLDYIERQHVNGWPIEGQRKVLSSSGMTTEQRELV